MLLKKLSDYSYSRYFVALHTCYKINDNSTLTFGRRHMLQTITRREVERLARLLF